MTVGELIKELDKIEDKSIEVITEGCDCDGDVGSVEVMDRIRDWINGQPRTLYKIAYLSRKS